MSSFTRCSRELLRPGSVVVAAEVEDGLRMEVLFAAVEAKVIVDEEHGPTVGELHAEAIDSLQWTGDGFSLPAAISMPAWFSCVRTKLNDSTSRQGRIGRPRG